MTNRRGDLAITPEGWAESQAKYIAERDRDPQMREMAKATKPTKDEQAAIEAAQTAVDAAEAAVSAAGFALNRAQRGRAPTYDKKRPFSFFEKSPAAHKAAADTPGLAIDLEEARSALQQAIRRRNDVARRVGLARMERRRRAKLAHTPKREPVKSRGDRWAHLDAR